jgi:hypothetical protein
LPFAMRLIVGIDRGSPRNPIIRNTPVRTAQTGCIIVYGMWPKFESIRRRNFHYVTLIAVPMKRGGSQRRLIHDGNTS